MDQRISLITIAVSHLDESRRFYLDGYRWEIAYAPGEITEMVVPR